MLGYYRGIPKNNQGSRLTADPWSTFGIFTRIYITGLRPGKTDHGLRLGTMDFRLGSADLELESRSSKLMS